MNTLKFKMAYNNKRMLKRISFISKLRYHKKIIKKTNNESMLLIEKDLP